MRQFVIKALKKPFTAVLIAIVVGFAIGAITLGIGGYNPARGFSLLFTGIFSSSRRVMQVLVNAVPIIKIGRAHV